MISKIFPSEMVATFLGSQSAASNLLASLGAILAGLILKSGDSSSGSFAICFLIAAGLLVLSWIALNQTKESPRIISIDTQFSAPLFSNIKKILKSDPVFRNFLISRFLSQFGMMAFAFYTVYAVKQIGMDTLTVGIMTSVLLVTQTIANPLLGWLADHWSRKWILAIGNICAVVSALLATIIKEPGWFAVPFILYGIANTSFWTIGMAFTLEFGTDIEKPVYVGMSNTLIAPATICAPLLGGLLADILGFSFTFIISSFFAFLTTTLLIFMVKDPKWGRMSVREIL
jgi:MFS family permease